MKEKGKLISVIRLIFLVDASRSIWGQGSHDGVDDLKSLGTPALSIILQNLMCFKSIHPFE